MGGIDLDALQLVSHPTKDCEVINSDMKDLDIKSFVSFDLSSAKHIRFNNLETFKFKSQNKVKFVSHHKCKKVRFFAFVITENEWEELTSIEEKESYYTLSTITDSEKSCQCSADGIYDTLLNQHTSPKYEESGFKIPHDKLKFLITSRGWALEIDISDYVYKHFPYNTY